MDHFHQPLTQISFKRVHDELLGNKITTKVQFVTRVQTMFINCLIFNECPTTNEIIRQHSFDLLDHFEEIYPPYNEVLKLRDVEFNSKPLMDVRSRSYCRLVMDEVIFCPTTQHDNPVMSNVTPTYVVDERRHVSTVKHVESFSGDKFRQNGIQKIIFRGKSL